MTMTNEREAFEARFHMLDRSTTSNAWGEFRFLHQPVQDLWEGWKARAAIAEQPQGEPVAYRIVRNLGNGGRLTEFEAYTPWPYLDNALSCEQLYLIPPQPTERSAELSDKQIDAAAKKMAECFDYPWEHMPEKGRQSMRDNVRAILDAAELQSDRSAELEAVQRDAWIGVDERVPDVGQEVLVYGKSPWEAAPSVKVDRWDELHESPVSFSSATIYVGDGWTEHDSDEITHWMPLPPEPIAAAPQKGESSTSGGRDL